MKNHTYPDSSEALPNGLLLSYSRALVIAAKGFASLELSLEEATSRTLDMIANPPAEAITGGDIATRLDPQRLLLLAIGVSRISGRSINSLTQNVLDAHPDIPSGFDAGAMFTLQALTSFDRIMSHGVETHNALLIPEFVVEDVADGTAFYAVRSVHCTQGTISLQLAGTRRFPRVDVKWVMGTSNTEASPGLVKLSQCLADSWATEQQFEDWVIYEGRCAEWRRLASYAAPQLSQ